jgi:hypothetical protein
MYSLFTHPYTYPEPLPDPVCNRRVLLQTRMLLLIHAVVLFSGTDISTCTEIEAATGPSGRGLECSRTGYRFLMRRDCTVYGAAIRCMLSPAVTRTESAGAA